MHEMSIATALLTQVLDIAEKNGLVGVERVEIEVGALQLVVPEMLETAFDAVVEGTPAAGAELIQREVSARAECRECGHCYAPTLEDYLCPSCEKANVKILEGGDIILKTITGPEKAEGGDP